jgi:cob(I)alamin adenosyltransferase
MPSAGRSTGSDDKKRAVKAKLELLAQAAVAYKIALENQSLTFMDTKTLMGAALDYARTLAGPTVPGPRRRP